MTEQQIRDRIRDLEYEIIELKAKLPKRQPKVKAETVIEYTDCRYCGEQSERFGPASYECPKCGPHNLFETVRTK